MFTVEEVAEQLNVSKVTIYAKLKKFDDKVVLKQGKKYITEELLSLIKQDLKVKEVENNSLNNADDNKYSNSEIAIDRDDLINLNKDLIKALMEQLDSKDRLLEEKDKQITELHKLIENSQILLKEERKKTEQQLYLLGHFEEVDNKLQDLREKMEQKRNDRKSLFKIFSKWFLKINFKKTLLFIEKL